MWTLLQRGMKRWAAQVDGVEASGHDAIVAHGCGGLGLMGLRCRNVVAESKGCLMAWQPLLSKGVRRPLHWTITNPWCRLAMPAGRRSLYLDVDRAINDHPRIFLRQAAWLLLGHGEADAPLGLWFRRLLKSTLATGDVAVRLCRGQHSLLCRAGETLCLVGSGVLFGFIIHSITTWHRRVLQSRFDYWRRWRSVSMLQPTNGQPGQCATPLEH